MKKLIIANWKMNPRTEREAVALARVSDAAGVVVCPPFSFIPAVKKVLRRAALGAQDATPGVTGPKTGEVSAGALKALGVRYVILGHSERRAEGERDARIAEKVRGALEAGLIPVLCVGEPRSVRRKGTAAAKTHVRKQLTADLSLATRHAARGTRVLIAYEPVWAISTSRGHRNETPDDAARMARFIRSTLRDRRSTVRVLYGGSVDSQNISSFLARREFSGVLVGGASVRPAEFRKVIRSAR